MDDQRKEHKEQYFIVVCNISYHVMVFLAAAKIFDIKEWRGLERGD